MTEFPTDWAGAHGTGSLRMSRGGSSTKGADVFGALGVYMVQGLALKAAYGGVVGFSRIGDDNTCLRSVGG